MRSRKALVSTIFGITYELVAAICGFIVPKLVMNAFGSEYNGITSSITQFLSCIVLIKTSIAGVTRAALYGPLSRKDEANISSIVKATEIFMRKVALIFAGFVFALAVVYPFFVKEHFDWFFSFSLVLILGISTFIQYYFGITYQILLEADQQQGFLYFVQIVTTLLNTLLAVVLIKFGASIHVVKLGSAIAFSFNPILINWYVCRRYKINKKVKPDSSAIQQRWDAFGQAAAAFVHNNTDMVVLTLFSTVYEVSVYTVYYMVCNGLKTLLKTFTSSVGAAFGNMLAKGEQETMQKNMNIFEYVGINFTTVLFTVAGIMMLPFVKVYTYGITDTNYERPLFSLLMVVGMALFCYRIPYQSVIEAAGHYKQTRNGALLEAAVNIIISVITVIRFGLVGVAIGTLIANLIRTVNYVGYLSKNIMYRSYWLFVKQMVTSLLVVVLTVAIANYFDVIEAQSYLDFGVNAMICTIICTVVMILMSLVFYRETFFALLAMIKRAMKIK